MHASSFFKRYHLPEILFLVTVGLSVAVSVRNLYAVPPPWPDEAIFSDMARHVLAGGRPVSQLYRDFIPFADSHAFWYPPLYFYVLAGAYRLLGTGFVQGRLLSVGLSVLSLAAVFVLVRKILSSRMAAAACLILMADVFFRAGAHIARMEMLTVFFGVSGLAVYVYAAGKRRVTSALAAGMLLGASVLSHPMGSIFLGSVLLTELFGRSDRKIRILILLILPTIIYIVLWLLPEWKYLNIFVIQYREQAIRKRYLVPYLTFVRTFRKDEFMLLLVYAVSVLWYAVRTVRTRTPYGRRLMAWLGIITIPLVYLMKEMWYLVYVSLAGAATLVANLSDIPADMSVLRYPFVVITGFFLLWPLSVEYGEGVFTAQAYRSFGAGISAAVPSGSRVMLSAIPDPYFYLTENRQDLSLREAPNSPDGQPVDRGRYDRVFAGTQYAVLTYMPNSLIAAYVRTNTATVSAANPRGPQRYTVVRLKPDELRRSFSAL